MNTKKNKILITAPYMMRDRAIVERLLENYPFEVTWAHVKERMSENDLLEVIEPFHGIICGDDRFTEEVYKKAKNLKCVVKWGTGIDSINKDVATKYNIDVLRTADAFTEPVSDTTLALILAFCRNIVINDAVLKNGGWDKPVGRALHELVVGIIGFGRIGQTVARKLSPFRPKIIANDIADKEEAYGEIGVEKVCFDEILESSDIITLHCDLNQSSYHILNNTSFSKMAKKPIIINTARGACIDEKSMISAIESGVISYVGLDVFEEEPLPLNSPLRFCDKALLSSHNSNSSASTWLKVHKNSLEMLFRSLHSKD